jgi:hypothetical protein
MFKRKPKMRTSAEKARRSQMNVFARLAGCAYLVYIIAQLVRDDTGGMSRGLRLAIAAVFGVPGAVIIGVTVVDFIKNFRAGMYKPSFYKDDFVGDEEAELEAFRARQTSGAADGSAPADAGALVGGESPERGGDATGEAAAGDAEDGGPE